MSGTGPVTKRYTARDFFKYQIIQFWKQIPIICAEIRFFTMPPQFFSGELFCAIDSPAGASDM